MMQWLGFQRYNGWDSNDTIIGIPTMHWLGSSSVAMVQWLGFQRYSYWDSNDTMVGLGYQRYHGWDSNDTMIGIPTIQLLGF